MEELGIKKRRKKNNRFSFVSQLLCIQLKGKVTKKSHMTEPFKVPASPIATSGKA